MPPFGDIGRPRAIIDWRDARIAIAVSDSQGPAENPRFDWNNSTVPLHASGLSTAAVMAQASLYTMSVVRKRHLATLFSAVLGGFFTFLYVALHLDTYALLCGSIGLFAVLSMPTVATRRVNWSAPQTDA